MKRQNKWLLTILWKLRRFAAGSFVLVVFSAICEYVFPILSMYFIDHVFPSGRWDLFNITCIAVGLMMVSRVCATLFSSYWITIFSNRTLMMIQRVLVRHLKRLPLTYLQTQQTGALTSKVLHGVWALEPLFSDPLFSIVRLTFLAASGLILSIGIAWQITLLGLGGMLLVIIPVSVLRHRLRALAIVEQEHIDALSARLSESFGAFYTEKIWQRERTEALSIFRVMRRLEKHKRKTAFLYSLSRTLNNTGITLVTLAVLWYGGIEVLSARLTPGQFVAINAFLASINSAITGLLSVLELFNQGYGLLDRVQDPLSIPTESTQSSSCTRADQIVAEELIFREVAFGYTQVDNVLRNVSLRVTKGEVVGIIGPSGAGKSTLINLVGRLHEPQSGVITLDGIDVKEYDLASLRRRVGIVPQELFSFRGTIADNISYSKKGATAAQIMAAAEVAGIHSFIESLPLKYAHPVEEGGRNLSIGQRQRIAIARAVLADTPILILDECTSALDLDTEAEIISRLRCVTANKITLVISHRPSLAQLVTRIYRLSGGILTPICSGSPTSHQLRAIELGSGRAVYEEFGDIN